MAPFWRAWVLLLSVGCTRAAAEGAVPATQALHGASDAGATGVSSAGATGVSSAGATGVSSAGATGVSSAGATGVSSAGATGVSSAGAIARSASIGSPTNGRMVGGVPLPLAGPGFRFNDRRSRDARFGTPEVVDAIARAARVVAERSPGSELVVNDLSLRDGGAIPHHGSHRAGRDADILFYLLDDKKQPTPSVGTALDLSFVGYDFKDLTVASDDVRVHLDARRTWRFVQALVDDASAPVQRIFVVEHVRTRLLLEAQRVKAPAESIARFADVSCQPSYPHDDHLHVRWYCSAEDIAEGCEDLPPLYPWHTQILSRLGIAPRLTQRTRSADPAPIVTNEQAEREVLRQKPHPAVLAFLAKRKAWEKQPHPGRPYCR